MCNFEGKNEGKMRKAALITGIIAVFITCVGIGFKLMGLPGSAIALLGAFIFIGIFSPLLLTYQLRQSPPRLKRLADITGLVVAFTLGVALTGLTLHWPLTYLLMFGMVVTALYAGLFFSSLNKTPGAKPFGVFTVLVLLFYVALAGGWMLAGKADAESGQKMAVLIERRARLKVVMEKNEQLVLDAVADRIHTGADKLHDQSMMVINELETLQNELINASSGHQLRGSDSAIYLERPLDYDTPTYFMIGENPAAPTGRAVGLRKKLVEFRTSDLAPEIPLDIDLSPQINGVSWEQANFYHVPVVDVLAYLVKIETAVLEAENTALEKGIFVK